MRPAGPARGIVSEGAPDGATEHARVLPSEALSPYVAHFWAVRWALRSPFTAETLPHPSVHVIFEEEGDRGARAEVAGVPRERFTRALVGDGSVFAVKFRPAAFSVVFDAPMSKLTDRVVRVDEIFGTEGAAWGRSIAAAASVEARMSISESFLTSRVSPLEGDVARVRDLVERMAVDRTLLRVEDVARVAKTDVRTLQRWFRLYVGVPPKWVLQRYRLHEAAERLRSTPPPSLAALADSLGYADQAHFARDFKRVVGRTPSAFVPASAR
jgi:AraC-like DNA-binding protein